MADTLKYRQITGLFSARLPDGSDADEHPDTVRLSGRVTFHPEYKKPLVFPGEHIVLEPIPALLVDGQLMVEFLQGDDVVLQDLYLPVTVDDRADQSWSWRMVFDHATLGPYGEPTSLPERRFPVPDGEGPLDLSEVAGRWSGGTLITRGAPGVGITEITATETGIRIDMEDGTTTVLDGLTRAPGTPIFPTQAEAAAWERANPGKFAIWVDGTPDPVGPDDGLLPIWFSAKTGLPPVGWTARYNTTAKTATLADGGFMRVAHNQAARWALTHDATGNVSGPVDVVMKMRATRTSTGGYSFGIITGGSGAGDSVTGNVIDLNLTGTGSTPRLRSVQYVGGAAQNIGSYAVPEFHDQWVWLRASVTESGLTAARMWVDGTPEPDEWVGGWRVFTPKAGWVGIFNSGDADADIGYFNVSVDGSPAPIVGI